MIIRRKRRVSHSFFANNCFHNTLHKTIPWVVNVLNADAGAIAETFPLISGERAMDTVGPRLCASTSVLVSMFGMLPHIPYIKRTEYAHASSSSSNGGLSRLWRSKVSIRCQCRAACGKWILPWLSRKRQCPATNSSVCFPTRCHESVHESRATARKWLEWVWTSSRVPLPLSRLQ